MLENKSILLYNNEQISKSHCGQFLNSVAERGKLDETQWLVYKEHNPLGWKKNKTYCTTCIQHVHCKRPFRYSSQIHLLPARLQFKYIYVFCFCCFFNKNIVYLAIINNTVCHSLALVSAVTHTRRGLCSIPSQYAMYKWI